MKGLPLVVPIASRLMRQPAAPYHEEGVWSQVEAVCREHGLACESDRWGNRLARLANAPKQRPLVLAAHMDHPGFEIVQRLGPARWLARFLGWVGDEYFREGVKLRLMPGAIPARLGRRAGKEKEFEIIAGDGKRQIGRVVPRFAVWELEDFAVRRGLIHGRSCDDLIGVSSILATLIELQRRRAKVHVIGLITRAEEVGFQGALLAVAAKALPKDALMVSLETSRELPPVRMGAGVIVRVGDRASVFGTRPTRFLTEAASDLRKRDKSFRFQRALMSGGTCEATVFQEHGFETAAVCVALGNYHNCGARNRIAAEFVSVTDAEGMTRLLTEAAVRMEEFDPLTGRLNQSLEKLLAEGRQRLSG